jgi:DNA-binding IclR family transcriptional regulator
MTYLKDGWEYLTDEETAVYRAIQELTRRKRTGNNSQIASSTLLSRTTVGKLTTELRMRGFIVNTGKGAAYHWRVTAQPVPYSTEARHAAIALRRRQRELNDQIRAGGTA